MESLQIPFMAGSSVPLFWRSPSYEPPLGEALETAVVLSYGGLEAYGYHGLELLQSFVERREGGETGLRTVQCLVGADAVFAAAAEGTPQDSRLSFGLAPSPSQGVTRGRALGPRAW